MIASGHTLRSTPRLIIPFCERTTHASGLTYGVGPAGYDVRIAESFTLSPGRFALASTVERFEMPNNMLGIVHDKSTWAREGLALQNTVIEPGWWGFLTLELSNHGTTVLTFREGMPIAQIVFHMLDQPVAPGMLYNGRYQDQARGPQAAKWSDRPERLEVARGR